MRAFALVISSSAVLAAVAGQALFFESPDTKIDTPVVAACSVQGGGCDQPPLDAGGQFVLSHAVLAGGCPGADLHVMR
jgi:hypothetical protein